VADHQRLFGRVTIDLGRTAAADQPTDVRIAQHAATADPQFAALLFQFGRYLLISSSRPGTQPANLQGIWNDQMNPPWGSKYTLNANLPMNYWPADTANLSECFLPVFDMIKDLAVTGARTAQVQYGAGGWVAHHNTDAWRGTSVVDGALWGMWQTGGAWLATLIWDHYLFTGDLDFLRSNYPVLKGAAQFFLTTLGTEPRLGYLVTNPSNSPELAHHAGASVCAGPTMDNQILRDLFEGCARASEALGADADFRAQVRAACDRLAPMRIGSRGNIQEWLYDWVEPERTHRHISHLYGLHPSNQITRRGTPTLFEAARRTLELRGDDGTGWSLAWKINYWARMEDGARAHKLLRDLVRTDRLAPNMFDLHPPFQIDGNFGATSGIAEMLLHSHNGELHVLPALPTAWPAGSVSGLRGRGAHTVGITWTAGRAREFTIRPDRDGTVVLRTDVFTGEYAVVDVGDGTTPATTRIDSDSVRLTVRAGRTYRVERRGTPAPSGYVKLVNRNSGKVLGVQNGSLADAAAIVQQTDTGATGQNWQVVDVGGGYVKLVNRNSGKVVDVNGGSTADGATVIQYRDHGGANQQWQLLTTGGYTRLRNRNSGKVLDVYQMSTADGAAIVQWADNGGANQQWAMPAGG
jgi:alpha-L-fucosidase 2